MTTHIDPFWTARIVPPSIPGTHPSTFKKPSSAIAIKSANTSTSSTPTSSRSNSPPSTPSSDHDDPWKFGIKTVPFPDAPATSATVTQFVEIIQMPFVRDEEDPSKWVIQKYKAPLDKFASSYVPLWLRNFPAPVYHHMLPPATPFPLSTYADLIIPSGIFTPRNVVNPKISEIESILLSAPPKDSLSVLKAPLDRFNTAAANEYSKHFSDLLAQQLAGQAQAMSDAKIHEIAITVDEVNGNTLKLFVPGIREDSPKLSIGDRMVLRPLDTYYRAPAPFVIEVEVVGLDKMKGGVYVTSYHLAGLHSSVPVDAKGNRKYQIEFKASSDGLCDQQDAVRLIGREMADDTSISAQWIWPQKEDHLAPATIDIPAYFDQDLNIIQQQAVADIASAGHTIPYLISGPPGTGKTKTIVEGALQILQANKDAKILLVAPSNAAADTLVRRLKAHLLPDVMFRLNSSQRTFAEVPQTVLPYCFIENDKFNLPPIQALMKYRIVVTTCSDAAILSRAKLTNVMIQAASAHFEEHLFRRSELSAPSLFWTHLLMDEAAQASEPEALVAIEVVLPARRELRPTVVLCGDIRQLGPVISSRQARRGGLEKSLLERLFATGAYPDVNVIRDRGVLAPCSYLVNNYRSMPAILMAPSGLFYNGSLKPAAKDVRMIKWSGLPNAQVPIVFRNCETEDSTTDEGASWYNEGEIDQVVDTILSLRKEQPDIQPKEIAVITPWREQVWRIRARLRLIGLHGVDVGHVESYQGAEFRVTILSCVRSRRRFIAGDRNAGTGFYDQAKRFNVAITRAKELLVVIGNADLLKGDVHWKGFLQVMLRHNLYVGPTLRVEVPDKPLVSMEYSVLRSTCDGQPWEGTDVPTKKH